MDFFLYELDTVSITRSIIFLLLKGEKKLTREFLDAGVLYSVYT